jgi:hypothetical protein
MNHDEVLARYRHLRALNQEIHHAAMEFLSRHAIVEQAKRLRIPIDHRLVFGSHEEMTLAYDLALYTAPTGRSRALDRYARAARFLPDSDQQLMLDAMRQAWFSIWRIERHHEVAGLIVTDALRQTEAWLMDESLASSVTEGLIIAARTAKPDNFRMTCGVIVPITASLMADANFPAFGDKLGDPEKIAQDPRFALAIYRTAV